MNSMILLTYIEQLNQLPFRHSPVWTPDGSSRLFYHVQPREKEIYSALIL